MAETLKELISKYIFHLERTLEQGILAWGAWSYPILFLVIFCETGLVVTPFLPGDSLLFFAGAISGDPKYHINVWGLFVVLSVAAVAGDTVNYWIGAYIGPRAFSDKIRFLKKEHLDRTHRFFEKYGGKTIILARFVPIVRTFAPFVAGIGAMSYSKFILYNVVGGVGWVGILLAMGYWLNQVPLFRDHLSMVVVAIVIISVLPMVVEYVRARQAGTSAAEQP